jgi:hypothetical protein
MEVIGMQLVHRPHLPRVVAVTALAAMLAIVATLATASSVGDLAFSSRTTSSLTSVPAASHHVLAPASSLNPLNRFSSVLRARVLEPWARSGPR